MIDDNWLRDLARQADDQAATAATRGELAQARHWQDISHAARQLVDLRGRVTGEHR